MNGAVKWKTRGRSFEKMAVKLASLSKGQLKKQLLSMRTSFRMDFTAEYLDSLSKDQLQHILLAAHLNAR